MDLLKSFFHPTELYALLQYKFGAQNIVHSYDQVAVKCVCMYNYFLLSRLYHWICKDAMSY